MKYLLFILFASLLIISCRNNEQVKQNTSNPKLSETDSLRMKFAPIINGDWVRADYVEDLKKTLSPWASYNNIGEEECDISIDTRKTFIDSAIVYVSQGGAGSATYVTFFKAGKVPNSILLETSEPYSPLASIGFEITASDTMLTLSFISDINNKTPIVRKYLHARNELTGNDSIPTQTFSGLAYFRNKLLVSGKYQYIDSTGKNATAIFNDFGKVTILTIIRIIMLKVFSDKGRQIQI